MIQNKAEMAPPRRRHFLFCGHLLIPVFILALTSILFRKFEWDLVLQTYLYRDAWSLGEHSALRALYHYGNIPALLTVLYCLYSLARIYFTGTAVTYRKLWLYPIIVLILGPGLLVNSILKDNWGRPRPRDITEFGGKYAYESPLQYDNSSPGKSFPCGHATMGFYFYALAFVAGRKSRLRFFALTVFATLFGGAIGFARMAQGGHFLSDVIWAGGLIYLVSFVLWRALSLDTRPLSERRGGAMVLKGWQKGLFILLGLLIILAVLLASPYHTLQNLESTAKGDYHLQIDVSLANVELSFGDSLAVHNVVSGFGFPSSKARFTRYLKGDTLSFVQKKKGFFTEFNAMVTVMVDTLHCKSLRLNLLDGELDLRIPHDFSDTLFVDSEAPLPWHHRITPARPDAKYLLMSPIT